jgi:hypothetical protein
MSSFPLTSRTSTCRVSPPHLRYGRQGSQPRHRGPAPRCPDVPATLPGPPGTRGGKVFRYFPKPSSCRARADLVSQVRACKVPVEYRVRQLLPVRGGVGDRLHSSSQGARDCVVSVLHVRQCDQELADRGAESLNAIACRARRRRRDTGTVSQRAPCRRARTQSSIPGTRADRAVAGGVTPDRAGGALRGTPRSHQHFT